MSVEADQALNEETPVKSEKLLEERGNDSSILEEKSRGSPALAGNEPSDQVNDKDEDIELNEDIIRKAIKERADHFRANSEYAHVVCFLPFMLINFCFFSNMSFSFPANI